MNNKKHKNLFKAASALLLCLNLAACSSQAVLTENPSDIGPFSENISESALFAEESSESIQANENEDNVSRPPADTDNWESSAAPELTKSAEDTAVTTAFVTEAPPAEWTEHSISAKFYINADNVYSTEKPLEGSTAVKRYSLNQAVNISAYTDTGYFKTDEGEYIYKSFLSADKIAANPVTTTTTAKPAVTTATTAPAVTTTTVTATAAATTTAPVTTTAVEEFIGRYNQRLQEQWEIDFANKIFDLTNEYRVQNGKAKLKRLENLDNAAAVRAWEILVDYRGDHTRPDGEKFSTVYDQFGIQYHYCGENIAAGQSTPEEVMDAWINSPAHLSNILSDKFTYLGVGMYYKSKDTYGYYWSQEFCALFE